jgi:hypothetical protein
VYYVNLQYILINRKVFKMLIQDARDEFYGLVNDDIMFAEIYSGDELGFYEWLSDNDIGLDD